MYSQPQSRVWWCCENCQELRVGRCYFSCRTLRRLHRRNSTWDGLFSLGEWSLCRMRWLVVHVVGDLNKGLVFKPKVMIGIREWYTSECCWIKVFVDENEGGVWVRAKWWRVVNDTTWHLKFGLFLVPGISEEGWVKFFYRAQVLCT